jgi:hypothetical protein
MWGFQPGIVIGTVTIVGCGLFSIGGTDGGVVDRGSLARPNDAPNSTEKTPPFIAASHTERSQKSASTLSQNWLPKRKPVKRLLGGFLTCPET